MAGVARPPVELANLSADDALRAIYAAQWTPMVRLAWLLVRDQGAAEDIVQDALLALHRRWDYLQDRAQAVGYLRRSVVNSSRSVLRHRKVESAYLAAVGPQAERQQSVASAEQSALSQLGSAAMLHSLTALPRRQREVLILRYYCDLSEAQIAEALGIAPGSVKAHAHRGLSALREQLATTRSPREDS